MPTRPSKVTLDTNALNILNAIRNNAINNYKDYVPPITDVSELKQIGKIIMDVPALQNEFLSALVNRIALVTVTSKMFDNPWAMFKKGFLEYGETIEEIFVDLVRVFEFDAETAETVSGCIMSLGSVVAYIVGEGMTDMAAIKSGEKSEEE